MQASISFNQSHKSSLSHNNRDHASGNKDIDPERSHLNVYFVKEDLREVYLEVFQEAVDFYNAKQSRDDRKIENYYDKIHNDSKTHEQRELVVAIGEGKDPGEFRNGKREALIKYAEEFQERNPNLRVYNMVLHDDEANPHLHINYVPHFESKRGLSKRVGMDKALQQQGIEGKGTELIGKWRTIETGRIEVLAKEHIPGFERANVGSHKYMKVPEFKEYAETLNMARRELENQKVELEHLEYAKTTEKGKLSELEQQVSVKSVELEKRKAELESINQQITKVETPLKEINSIDFKEKMFGNVQLKKEDFDKVMSWAKHSINADKEKIDVQQENEKLKGSIKIHKINLEQKSQQVDRYRQENMQLKRENRQLFREKNKLQKLLDFAIKLFQKLNVWEKVKPIFMEQEKQIDRQQKQQQQSDLER